MIIFCLFCMIACRKLIIKFNFLFILPSKPCLPNTLSDISTVLGKTSDIDPTKSLIPLKWSLHQFLLAYPESPSFHSTVCCGMLN